MFLGLKILLVFEIFLIALGTGIPEESEVPYRDLGTKSVTCDIRKYGGVADSKTDIGPAISKAFEQCIKSGGANSVLLIPSGEWLIDTFVSFRSFSNWNLQLEGNVHLKFNPATAKQYAGQTVFQWVHCDYVKFYGKGTIYGHGEQWRPNGELNHYSWRARLVRFQDCDHVSMHGLTLNNSPSFHIAMMGNNNLIYDITITADNVGTTDGIDISGNNNVVRNVKIKTGDECVTVKSPTNGFLGENIYCYQTAGNQIGSFGWTKGSTAAIENVLYRNVVMEESQSGAQIKSFPLTDGYIRNVTYENFKLINVLYPASIDLFWCPHTDCPAATGNLIVSDISFINFYGTQADTSRPIARARCIPKAKGYSCKNIKFEKITVKSASRTIPDVIQSACGKGRSLPSC